MRRVTQLSPDEIETVVDEVVKKQHGLLSNVNVSRVSAVWRKMVQAKVGVAFSAELKGGYPLGFLLALFTPDAITGESFAIQYLWMVSPEFRNSGTALDLLKAFEDEARARGCVRILTGSNQVSKPDAMRRLFRRLGYAPFSEAFSKELK